MQMNAGTISSPPLPQRNERLHGDGSERQSFSGDIDCRESSSQSHKLLELERAGTGHH